MFQQGFILIYKKKKKKGKKFVIKDLFGYTFTNSENDSINTNILKDEFSNFVSKVVESCSSNDFEKKNCSKKSKEDLNDFNRKNDTNFGFETTDEVDSFKMNSDDDRDDNNTTRRNKSQTQSNHKRYNPRSKPRAYVNSHEQVQIHFKVQNINVFLIFVHHKENKSIRISRFLLHYIIPGASV